MSDQHPSGDDLRPLADRVRSALEAGPDALRDLLDPDVTWGDCRGADAVVDVVRAAATAGLEARDVTVEVVDDRIVVEFATGDAGSTVTQAIFARDGRIAEIVDAEDRSDALSLRPVGDLDAAAGRGWTTDRVSPVLPVADLAGAVERYRSLGFEVRVYDGDDEYAFAGRGAVELHLAEVPDIDPASNSSACYLYVDDADAQYAAWRLAAVDGRLVPPVDTDYGMREGAYVDPDGNLLRFGS